MSTLKAKIYLAEGFEESEALVPFDVLCRAGIEPSLVAVGDSLSVRGSHGICVNADSLLSDELAEGVAGDFDILVLPGGMPGTLNLKACEPLGRVILAAAEAGKTLAAICAAPIVFGGLGLLRRRTATCFPGFEDELCADLHSTERVVVDGNFITGRGAGCAFDFGLAIVASVLGADKARQVKEQMIY